MQRKADKRETAFVMEAKSFMILSRDIESQG